MSAKGHSVSRFPRTPVTVLIIALIMALAAPSLAFVAVLHFQSDTISHRQMEARAQQGVSAISQTLDRELRQMVTYAAARLAGQSHIAAARAMNIERSRMARLVARWGGTG